MKFQEFNKIARWSRDIVITEKLDGTNASIFIGEDGTFLTGSRNRWITPEDDNFGFSRWAHDNKENLLGLGAGFHYGEWWGSGIQRRYGLTEKRFSLFNVHRWGDAAKRPACCHVVPTIYIGLNNQVDIGMALQSLIIEGSYAAPGFKNPEGIVIYHTASRTLYKKTIDNDASPKSKVN